MIRLDGLLGTFLTSLLLGFGATAHAANRARDGANRRALARVSGNGANRQSGGGPSGRAARHLAFTRVFGGRLSRSLGVDLASHHRQAGIRLGPLIAGVLVLLLLIR